MVMKSHPRPSPRAAIRDWLSHSATRATNRQRSSPSRSRRHCGTEEDIPQWNQDQSNKTSRKDITRTSTEVVNPRSPEKCKRNDENLPRRLCLYAPFRSFGRESNHLNADEYVLKSKRKRKRSLSVSSNVEPATFRIYNDVENDNCDKREGFVPGELIYGKDGTDSASADGPSQLSAVIPEMPNYTYERKSRHKTRDDQYQLKQREDVNKPRNTMRKHNTKEKRGLCSKKSGSALMHGFVAENVAVDRLTLKSTSTVGVFSRGRASSPVKRKGLLDQASLEAAFHKSRMKKPDDLAKPAVKRFRAKMDGAVDPGVELSRYFTSRQPASQGFPPGVKSIEASDKSYLGNEYRGHRDRKRESRYSATPLKFVDPPSKPFLGFGSAGGDMTSSAWTSQNTDAKTDSLRVNASPTRSATYVSWSVSREPSHHSGNVKRWPNDASIPQADLKHHNKASEQASVKKTAHLDPPHSLLQQNDLVQGGDFEDKLNQQNSRASKKKALAKTNESERSKFRKRLGIENPIMNCVEELVPDFGLMSGQDELEEEEPSTSFDVALENFLRKWNPIKQPARNSTCSTNAHRDHRENSWNSEREISPDLNQVNDSLPNSRYECMDTRSNDSAMRCNFIELLSAPPTRPFEHQVDQSNEQPKLTLAEHSLQINPCIDPGTYDSIYEHQLELEGYTPRRNGGSKHGYIRVDHEATGEFTFSGNHVNSTSFELGGPKDYESENYYELDCNTRGFEEQQNNAKIESPMNDMEDLSSHYTNICGAGVVADPSHNHLIQQALRAEYYSVLEDNYPYVPNHESDTFEWPDNEDGLRNSTCESNLQESHQSWNSLHQYQTQSGTGDITDNRQLALLQRSEEETWAGFWKPHKLS